MTIRAITAAAALAAAAAFSAAALPARAQDAAADQRFVTACLDLNLRHGAASAEQRCVGLIAMSCMNAPGGATSEGQAACLGREAGAWQTVMQVAYDDLEPHVAAYDAKRGGDAHAALMKAHEAWTAYAQAECDYAHALWAEGDYRDVAAADCRMNVTARRAIQLRAQVGAGS